MNSAIRTILLLFLTLCSAAALLIAAETPSTSLLVLSKGDHALFIVDPATLAVVGQVPSGPDPHEVIADSDGKIAYISNYGFGAYNTITPVDLINQKALPVIDLGPLRGPHGLDFAGGKLWFTAEGAKVIGSYDPSSRKVDWVMGTGQDRTHMLYVFPGLDHIVTSNVSSATMSFLDSTPPPNRPPNSSGQPPPPASVRWTETVVPVGRGAEGFDLTPDGKELWTANAQDGTISIMDVAAKKVTQTLDADVRGANRLKFTPDGKLALVSTLAGPDLSVFDVAFRKAAKLISIGHGAAGILVQPDGSRAFVSCTPDSYVAIIDIRTLEMTGKITAGKNPDGLAWAVRK
ncbi:MAG TPA: hypothetical protein VJN93_04830 [Candidatus Acidoferrum sp.]|nr:hypothetical protein [Candidatus Acidoferrum sp.]